MEKGLIDSAFCHTMLYTIW